MTIRRRRRAGFSLIETMVAAVVLLEGLIGTSLFIQYTVKNAVQADFNLQAAKRATELLTASSGSGLVGVLGKIGSTEVCNGAFPNGQNFTCSVQYIDTSSPTDPLPAIGAPSVLIRVTIWRIAAQLDNGMTAGSRKPYVMEAYVL